MAQGSHDRPEDSPADPADAPDTRPRPAEPPVLDRRAVTAGEAVEPAQPRPYIDSTTVGRGGGLPPAQPLALTDRVDEADAAADLATDMDTRRDIADAPDLRDDPVAEPSPARTGATAGPPPDLSGPAVAAVPAPVPRRGGFWPGLFGGILGGAAAWAALTLGDVGRLVPVDRPDPPPAVAPAVTVADAPAPAVDGAALRAAVDAALADQRAAFEDSARTAGAEAAAADLAALRAEMAALAERTAAADAGQPAGPDPALQEAIAALQARVESLTAAPETPVATAPALEQTNDAVAENADTLADLRAQLVAQAAAIAALEDRPTLDPAEADAIRALSDEAKAAQDDIAATLEAAEAATRRAEAVAAIAAVQAALDRGLPADEAVAGLAAAGVAAPEALAAPVVPLTDLQDRYDDAARAALRADLRSRAQDQGAGGVIANFLRAQTGARSTTPRAGSDADAVLSRAGAAVAAGDLDTALAELAALPAPAREAGGMAAWITDAEAHRAARAAAAELTGAAPAAAVTN